MNENEIVETTPELTAGEMLRNVRTTGRRKREISTIAKQLCIREEFLQALEDGKYTVIPETVYILGFARNYAMELGVDPDVIVSKIKQEMGLVPECGVETGKCEDASVVRGTVKTKSIMDLSKEGVLGRVWAFVVRHWRWFVGALVALVLLIIGLLFFVSASDVESAGDANVVTTVPESGIVFNAPVRETFGSENAEKANVVLQAMQESWIKIEDGRGNTVFSRVLVAGDVYYVPAGDKYKATFGNAGGVDIWVNGVLAPKAGAEHERKSGVSMSPDSLTGKVSE